jgi:hypothetical protein
MALVICPDCGKQISDKAPACPNCGRPAMPQPAPQPVAPQAEVPLPPPKKKGGCGTAFVILLLAMVILGALVVVMSSIFSGGSSTGQVGSVAPRPAAPPPIPYSEIWRGREQPGGINRHYLVSTTATKEDVLRLAAYLKAQAEPRKYVFIEIWDSAESHRRRQDESYPASEVFRHHLVSVTVNPTTGFDETQWTAEGR